MLEANGKGLFRFASAKGNYTQIAGKKIVFQMTKQGSLKNLTVTGDAKISEENEEKGPPRYIEGPKLRIQGNKNLLTVEGDGLSKARMWSEELEITAKTIRLFLETNNIETILDTKVIVYPRKNGKEETGFFSDDSPIFITSQDMRYSDERRRFKFIGGTKLWQKKETFKAQEMTLGVETEAFRAQGGVESVLPYQPKDKEKEENVWIGSSIMEYDPEKNLIKYRNDVKLRLQDIQLSAKLLVISLDAETGDMENIVARNDVVVTQKAYSGLGEEARFDVGEEVITVLGNPVLIDKDKGKTEGGKLTFSIPDGRIVVENEDGDRSVTVIKSES
jgi:lipopolysaccharide export system protein LptA